MKKTILTLILLTFVLILAACAGSASEESAPVSAIGNDEGAGPSMPHEITLLMGTFKLDETKYPIDAAQASEMLPLWKAARSLSESETVATAELEAIFDQIKNTLTPEQVAAITAMQLSQNDFANLAQSLGIEISNNSKFGDMTPEMQATAQAMRESGQESNDRSGTQGGDLGQGNGPGGGAPAGDVPVGASPAKEQGRRGAASVINSQFFDVIIELLEAKIK